MYGQGTQRGWHGVCQTAADELLREEYAAVAINAHPIGTEEATSHVQLDDLLSQIPMDQLAQQLGVDEQTAERATRQALPALLAGMDANAQDPAGAAYLANALGQHDDALLDGGLSLDQVDTNDGDKIVGNVLGDSRDQVVNRLGGGGALGGSSGTAGEDLSGLVAKFLPILAPIVMSFLAKQFLKGGRAGAPGSGRWRPG